MKEKIKNELAKMQAAEEEDNQASEDELDLDG